MFYTVEIVKAATQLLDWFLGRRATRRAKVLVVEDDSMAVVLLDYLFKKHKISYDIVASAEEALGALNRDGYQCVCLDMRLPFMRGAALLKNIKEQFPDMNIVIICGEAGDLREIQSSTFFSAIVKPLTNQSVIELKRQFRL